MSKPELPMSHVGGLRFLAEVVPSWGVPFVKLTHLGDLPFILPHEIIQKPGAEHRPTVLTHP
jgi:hypothetical protein